MGWPGEDLLKERRPVIGFSDLLWVKERIEKVERSDIDEGIVESSFKAKPGLGERLKAIVDQAADSDAVKLQKIVLEFVKVLALVCLGSDSAAAVAQYWAADNHCPLRAVRGGIVGLTSARYTSVVLGHVSATVREKVNGIARDTIYKKKVVQLSLHRVATFLARGHPPPAQMSLKGIEHEAQANHKCAEKQCLRLECLKWGTFTTNLEDAYEKEYERSLPPKDPEDPPAPSPAL